MTPIAGGDVEAAVAAIGVAADRGIARLGTQDELEMRALGLSGPGGPHFGQRNFLDLDLELAAAAWEHIRPKAAALTSWGGANTPCARTAPSFARSTEAGTYFFD